MERRACKSSRKGEAALCSSSFHFFSFLSADLDDFPSCIEQRRGKQTMSAKALDAWLGGDWWRTHSKAVSTHAVSAHLHADTDITIELYVESLVLHSHHICKRCTWAAGFRLNTASKGELRESINSEPRLALIMRSKDKPKIAMPSFRCEPDSASAGAMLKFKFTTVRDIQITRRLMRRKLGEAYEKLCFGGEE